MGIPQISFTKTADEISTVKDCIVTWQCNENYLDFETRATLTGEPFGRGIGILVNEQHSSAPNYYPANTDSSFVITHDTLNNADGTYRISMYVKNKDGIWSDAVYFSWEDEPAGWDKGIWAGENPIPAILNINASLPIPEPLPWAVPVRIIAPSGGQWNATIPTSGTLQLLIYGLGTYTLSLQDREHFTDTVKTVDLLAAGETYTVNFVATQRNFIKVSMEGNAPADTPVKAVQGDEVKEGVILQGTNSVTLAVDGTGDYIVSTEFNSAQIATVTIGDTLYATYDAMVYPQYQNTIKITTTAPVEYDLQITISGAESHSLTIAKGSNSAEVQVNTYGTYTITCANSVQQTVNLPITGGAFETYTVSLTAYIYDPHTLVLLHGKAFTDSSKYHVAVTNSKVTLSTEKPNGFEGSYEFNGAAKLTVPWAVHTKMTIDWWEKAVAGANTRYNDNGVEYGNGGTGVVFAKDGSTAKATWKNAFNVTAGEWVHWAITRNESNFVTYRNGTQFASYNKSGTIKAPGANLKIGLKSSNGFKGMMTEIRISDVVRWTSNFTVPTAPYTNLVPPTE